MTTRAKFRCSLVEPSSVEHIATPWETVRFDAVYSPDPESENYSWSKWTPNGSLSMTITNPNIFGKFEVGKEYFLDISEVSVVE